MRIIIRIKKPWIGYFVTLFLSLYPIVAFSQLKAAFTADRVSGCVPLTVTFQDNSTGNPTSWQWNLGNGTIANKQNPSVSYLIAGTYTVSLKISNASGKDSITKIAFITIYDNPIADFTASNTSGCYPLKVNFTDLSKTGTGNIAVWNWDLGDGDTSLLQNPSHNYTVSGNYSVTLKVINNHGCFSLLSKSQYIQVATGVTDSFANSPVTYCKPPETINFTNVTAGPGALTYQWDFGDGGISTEKDPLHTYTTSGTYSVQLITKSSVGCADTLVKQNIITIRNYQTDFTGPDSICITSNAVFNVKSLPAPVNSLWNLGDGTTSNLNSVTKTWSTPAVYRIKLVNNYGVCTDSVSKIIAVLSPPNANFTSTDSFNCKAPFSTQFNDLTIGSTSWLWNFGDGSTSTVQNPSHTYNTAGQYDVTLIVANTLNCADTIIKKQYISVAKPKTKIANLPGGGCIPFIYKAMAITNDPKGIATYLWDFGDDTISTLQNPVHTYYAKGVYKVKLYYTTNDGCSDSVVTNDTLKTGTPTTVDFTAAPVTQCAQQNIQFTNLSPSSDTWAWSFGDGQSSSDQNPQHAYDESGPFSVKLTVTSNGCPVSLTKNNFITVLPPVAKFTPIVDCGNKTHVNFVDSSTMPLTWQWDFGDGSTSTSSNPQHIFPTLGSYDVTLTVTNGNCTTTKKITLKLVNEHADFTTQNDTVCTNAPILFSAINSNAANISNYTFYFGDGSFVSSAVGRVSHAFPDAGIYSVKLVITDINGCKDSLTKTNYITVIGPHAAFSASTTSGCRGVDVTFTDHSTTDGIHVIKTWQWNYGDGITDNLTAPPFIHAFDSAGSFNVILKITDTNGCSDSAISNSPINVIAPDADFSSIDTLICIGSDVIFKNLSTEGNDSADKLSYVWVFGNGDSSVQIAPVTTYHALGLYSVKLIATDKTGCKDSVLKNNYIRIAIPKANYSVNDSVASCTPFEVFFTNKSIDNTGQVWDFGDGSSSDLKNPIHYYSVPGKYIATLYSTLPIGCADSFKRTITLHPSSATLTYNPLSGCKEVASSFHVSTASLVNYFWDFGDGNTLLTTDSNTSHIYEGPGSFVPNVILTNAAGCQVILTGKDTVHVIKSLVNFGTRDSAACFGNSFAFKDSTKNNAIIAKYNWDFGDGTISTLENPVHAYSSRGIFSVRLITTTADGCTDSLTKENYIHVFGPMASIQGSNSTCAGDSLSFNGIWSNPDEATVSWKWIFANGETSALQDPPEQFYPTAGSFPIQLILTAQGCSDTVTSIIVVHALPQTNAGNDENVCLNSSAQLNATGADTYSWSPATYLSCISCTNPVSTPVNDITYAVRGENTFGCVNTDSVRLIVKKPFKLTVTPITDSLCAGQSVKLTASGTEVYNWSPSSSINDPTSNSTFAAPATNTIYKVVGKDVAGCYSDSAFVNISVFSYPTVNAGSDKNISFGQTVTLMPTYSKDIISYAWTPATGLNCSDCPNPVATLQNSTRYTVTVTNSGGCTSTADIAVLFPCQVSIFIPNTFSPNNDGMNDYFYPRGRDIYLIKSMRVFDRWGELVFQRTDFSANAEQLGWDGKFKGQPASLDVYTYVIEVLCNNNNISTYQGDITLIR